MSGSRDRFDDDGELEQLAQRVIARYHLDALSEEETAQYIQHRLETAGLKRGSLFERKALKRIHELTRGVPRRINLLCDRALLGAYAEGKARVDKAVVEKAAEEVFESLAVPEAAAPGVGMMILSIDYRCNPLGEHGHEALEHCAMDAHCWDALAWIFEQWLADWRMRGAKGFTARTRDWEQRVPRNSPVRRLPWKAEAQGHMTFHGLASGRTHEHSAWSAVRWLSLSAWVLRQLRT